MSRVASRVLAIAHGYRQSWGVLLSLGGNLNRGSRQLDRLLSVERGRLRLPRRASTGGR
jgi:hypothetical protein